jgi:hypothetical protein
MKVSVITTKDGKYNEYKNLYNTFIKFLQKEFPLSNDIKIRFLSDRVGKMTTGSRTDNGILNILVKSRINRDILRTLSHEWVHEYQMTILNRNKGKNIGGKNENEANAESGIIIKKFEKRFPNFEKLMYD